jgi:hypothetical protein
LAKYNAIALGIPIIKGLFASRLLDITVTATKQEVKIADAQNTTNAYLDKLLFALFINGIGSIKAGTTIVCPTPLNNILIVMPLKPPSIYETITSATK